MSNKKVAVILVNWNSFDITNDCIESLKNCTYSELSILVVDNGSEDDSVKKLELLQPGIILIKSDSNRGFTGGNNLGLQYSLENDFDYSLLLNNDTFVEPDFLAPLVNYMNDTTNTGAIQPKIFFHNNRNLIWNAGSYFNRLIGFSYIKGFNRPSVITSNTLKKVDWITGCAFFIRNTVLRQTGLLAENMFMYSEDLDLSFRIHRTGYRLMYHPQSVIYHIAGMSGKTQVRGEEGYLNPVVHYYNVRNRIWILKKYIPWYFLPTAILFNFFYILMLMGYFAMRGRFKKLKMVEKAIRDGLSGSIRYH